MNEQLEAGGNRVYAPPLAQEQPLAQPSELARLAGYRKLSGWAWAVTAAFGAYALTKGLGAIADVVLATAGNNYALSEQTTVWNNRVVYASQIFRLPALLAFYALLVIANKNARIFVRAEQQTNEQNAETEEQDQDEAEDSEAASASDHSPPARAMSVGFFSPASMVWWYFVPVMNAFRPYQALKAVWVSSKPLGLARGDDGAALPRYWWSFWLGAACLLALSGLRTGFGLSYVTRDMILLAVNLSDATSCLLTIGLARALESRQRQRARELWG